MENHLRETTLISDEYRSEQYQKHVTDPDYGGESVEYANQISTIINQTGIEEVLDYGAGKGELPHNLTLDHRVSCHLYDPAIPAIASYPEPKDMVTCVDVLNYVEDKYIEAVLDDLKRVTKHLIFIVITEDHRDMEWWLPKIMSRFNLQSLVRSSVDFYVIAEAKHEH